jgi:hypothetical protein
LIEPRFAWAPASARTLGDEAIAWWEAAGGHLFDWQKVVIRSILALDAEDQWATADDGLDVARQNGKGVVLQVVEAYAAFELDYPVVMHTAHEFATSQEHQLRLESFIQDAPSLHSRVRERSGYRHANGQESINLKSGCRILFKSRTTGSGRGYSADLLVWDEAMVINDKVVGAQKPMTRASTAKHGSKTIYAGSAVDRLVHEHGVNFARIRKRGLEQDPRVSWHEWSAEGDPAEVTIEMLSDMSLARAANPSMADGLISEDTVLDEISGMPPRTAAVELYGMGDWPPTDASVSGLFDAKHWASLAGDVELEEPTLSLDVSPIRTWATIMGAKRVGDKVQIGLVDRQAGTGWIVDRLVELIEELRPERIVCDDRGPAASLLDELEEAGVVVETIGTVEYTRACGMFFDAVEQGTIVHDGDSALEAAVRGAAQRTLADAWAWSRKHSRSDITPLVAATIAYRAEATQEKRPFVAVGFA